MVEDRGLSLGISLLIVIGVIAIFELSLLAVSFLFADEIECNWLWCTFKTTRVKTVVIKDNMCYENGELINCSENMGDINWTEFNRMMEGVGDFNGGGKS